MIKLPAEARQFGLQIREFFRKQSQCCRPALVDRNSHVYTSGQRDGMIYFIDSGW